MRTKQKGAAATESDYIQRACHQPCHAQPTQSARPTGQAEQPQLAQPAQVTDLTQHNEPCRQRTGQAAPAPHTTHAAHVAVVSPASAAMPAQTASAATRPPLLPMPQGCVIGSFVQRRKRFSVELRLNGEELWVHSNNSGSMLGLTRPGTPVLASPAANPARKLKYTQECVWLPQTAMPAAPAASDPCALPGFWVGVNTNIPNRMLEAAFHAGRLNFAQGYTSLVREAKRGQSRLDGLLTGPGQPPLWVECKNVTMMEDDAACFPDAASERGQKHLRELMDIVAQGERAAMLYLVQRPDGRCFAPADFIDPEYARLFYDALSCGVEIYPYRALVEITGIDLGPLIPLRPAPQRN